MEDASPCATGALAAAFCSTSLISGFRTGELSPGAGMSPGTDLSAAAGVSLDAEGASSVALASAFAGRVAGSTKRPKALSSLSALSGAALATAAPGTGVVTACSTGACAAFGVSAMGGSAATGTDCAAGNASGGCDGVAVAFGVGFGVGLGVAFAAAAGAFAAAAGVIAGSRNARSRTHKAVTSSSGTASPSPLRAAIIDFSISPEARNTSIKALDKGIWPLRTRSNTVSISWVSSLMSLNPNAPAPPLIECAARKMALSCSGSAPSRLSSRSRVSMLVKCSSASSKKTP